MKKFPTVIFAIVSVTMAAKAMAQEPPTPGALGVKADHHLHARSQAELEFMFEINEKLGAEFKGPPLDPSMTAILAEELIEQLDQAGVRYGALLSSAYFFEFPEYEASREERQHRVREANNFAAAQVAKFPDRLRAFCSVNPLSDYAASEVARCKQELNITGIKLHFGGSDVDLRNSGHLSVLREFFGHIKSLELPVVLHLRTRNPDYGRIDVMNFVSEVLVPNPGLELQIAHLSGQGSYDENTHDALSTWADVLDSGVIENSHTIAFDVSATVTRHPAEEYSLIANTIRRLGTSRIYMGSDWPAFNKPRWVAVNFKNQVPLTEEEMNDILDNVAPYFKRH